MTKEQLYQLKAQIIGYKYISKNLPLPQQVVAAIKQVFVAGTKEKKKREREEGERGGRERREGERGGRERREREEGERGGRERRERERELNRGGCIL